MRVYKTLKILNRIILKRQLNTKILGREVYCVKQSDHIRCGKMCIKQNEFRSSVLVLRRSVSVTCSVIHKEHANSRTWCIIQGVSGGIVNILGGGSRDYSV